MASGEMSSAPVLFVPDDIPVVKGRPPATAEEYLAAVRHEAECLPAVVVAENLDATEFAALQTFSAPEVDAATEAPEHCRPDASWCRNVAAVFVRSRQAVARQRACRTLPPSSGQLPSSDDVDGWAHVVSSSSTVLPSLGLVAGMSQASIHAVLRHFVLWLDNEQDEDAVQPEARLEPSQARWLYAVLAALDKPLNAHLTAKIRDVARSMARLRLQHQHDPWHVATANLFIFLARDVFEQHDLA
eukprot:m.205744 g.205744  ORF g.205744 m.205744 type:complete len:244 (-) comp18490_c0_seq7:354-1085(-)